MWGIQDPILLAPLWRVITSRKGAIYRKYVNDLLFSSILISINEPTILRIKTVFSISRIKASEQNLYSLSPLCAPMYTFFFSNLHWYWIILWWASIVWDCGCHQYGATCIGVWGMWWVHLHPWLQVYQRCTLAREMCSLNLSSIRCVGGVVDCGKIHSSIYEKYRSTMSYYSLTKSQI